MKNNVVYLKTTRGLKRVDVIYRRVDDDFLDPLCLRSDSTLGIAGVINAWRAGNVALVNAPGSGIADDKAVYAYVPDIIRYYLGEQPILQNVPTYQMTNPDQAAYVLDHLDRMVIKAVAESGGYGMLMGPSSTPALRAQFAAKIKEDPRNYIAQPVVPLSRHVCYLDGELESPHRPAAVYHLRPGDRGRSRRPHPRRAHQGLAGGQLLARRRQQGHLGAGRSLGCLFRRRQRGGAVMQRGRAREGVRAC